MATRKIILLLVVAVDRTCSIAPDPLKLEGGIDKQKYTDVILAPPMHSFALLLLTLNAASSLNPSSLRAHSPVRSCSFLGGARCLPGTTRHAEIRLGDKSLLAECQQALGIQDATASTERLKVGNTNKLFKLTAAGENYLVRVFGSNPALAFDRDAENVIYKELSSQGLVPKLVAEFSNGRIEEWLVGRPANTDECRSDVVAQQVAAQMARLHAFQPTHLAGGVEPWGWTTASSWLEGARSASTSREVLQDQAIWRRVKDIDLDHISSGVEELRTIMGNSRLSLVFAHNDLSNTNVHWDADRKVARLIDFEYGGLNYRGFDLATHLSHWAGGALNGLYEDELFPSTFEQQAFLVAYAKQAEGPTVKELQHEIFVAKPLVHLVWGLWAICMLPVALRSPPGPFSHIEYAERRLRAFRKSLDELKIT